MVAKKVIKEEKAAEVPVLKAPVLNLKRNKPAPMLMPPPPPGVSNGPVNQMIDVMYNSTRQSIRGLTNITREMADLLPQLDAINLVTHYCKEVAQYRENADVYHALYDRECPVQPDIIDDYIYGLAVWRRSINGDAMKSGVDITLAQTETQANNDGLNGNPDFSE